MVFPGVVLSSTASISSISASVNSGLKRLLSAIFSQSCKMFSARFIGGNQISVVQFLITSVFFFCSSCNTSKSQMLYCGFCWVECSLTKKCVYLRGLVVPENKTLKPPKEKSKYSLIFRVVLSRFFVERDFSGFA